MSLKITNFEKMMFWLVHRVFFLKLAKIWLSWMPVVHVFRVFGPWKHFKKRSFTHFFNNFCVFDIFFSKICVFYSDPLASLTLKNNTFLFYLFKDHFGEYLAIFALRFGLLLYLKSKHFLKEIAKNGKQWRFFRLNSC